MNMQDRNQDHHEQQNGSKGQLDAETRQGPKKDPKKDPNYDPKKDSSMNPKAQDKKE